MGKRSSFWLALLVGILALGMAGLPQQAAYADDNEAVYRISNAAQLRQLADKVNGTDGEPDSMAGVKIVLTADIDLAEDSWQPIGMIDTNGERKPFAGEFDGNGHTISGLLVECEKYGALFGYTEGAVIKNLRVQGKVTVQNGSGAAFVAEADAGLIMQNCITDVAVNATDAAGGLAAVVYGDESSRVCLENCRNEGRIRGLSYVGGIVGSGSGDVMMELTNCQNYGEIGVAASNNSKLQPKFSHCLGGLGGELKRALITGCLNEGTVNAPQSIKVGGLVGSLGTLYNHNFVVTASANHADVTGKSSVGGLFGDLSLDLAGSVQHCYNSGDVQGNNIVGGLVGENKTELWNCFFYGSARAADGEKCGLFGQSSVGGRQCYALPDCIETKNGSRDPEAWVEVKTAPQFASGEVAWLLDGASIYDRSYFWTQGEHMPLLTDDKSKVVYCRNAAGAEPDYFVGADNTLAELLLPKEAGEAKIVFYRDFAAADVYMETAVPLAGKLAEPAPPTRPDTMGTAYEFTSWYREPWLEHLWDFSTDKAESGQALYAGWRVVDLFGLGTEQQPYLLHSAAELAALAEKNAAGERYAGKYFKLAEDIVLDGNWQQGIGVWSAPFEGSFDGGGHTVTMQNVATGLFGFCGAQSRLCNLNISGDICVAAEQPLSWGYKTVFGALAEISYGKVENCAADVVITVPAASNIHTLGGLVGELNDGSMINCRAGENMRINGAVSDYAGGLVGVANNALIKDAVSRADIDVLGEAVGGVVGMVSNESTGYDYVENRRGLDAAMQNCVNYGKVRNAIGAAAGVVGGSSNGSAADMQNCANYGNIAGGKVAAGILAANGVEGSSNYGNRLTFDACHNSGYIVSEQGSAGGIYGSTDMSNKPSLNVAITNSSNSGTVKGVKYVGGIAGMFDSLYGEMGASERDLAQITDCQNTGDVYAAGEYAGGILGANTWYGRLTLARAENSGDVSGSDFVGGIAGYIDPNYDNTARDVFSSGNIRSAGANVNGLVGSGNLQNGVWTGRLISADTVDLAYPQTDVNENKQSEANDIEASDDNNRVQNAGVRPESTPDITDGETNTTQPEPTVFEVVRNTVAENPLISLMIICAILFVIGLGGLRRYSKSKSNR